MYATEHPAQTQTMALTEHVVLVALTVYATSPQAAQGVVMDRLEMVRGGAVESWWLAQDDRTDGSDCDSAVFVGQGRTRMARALIRRFGLDRPVPGWGQRS